MAVSPSLKVSLSVEKKSVNLRERLKAAIMPQAHLVAQKLITSTFHDAHI